MGQIDINRLWQNFVDTITNHYADFNGRIGRAQFWYYILVYVVISIGVTIVGSIVGSGGGLRHLYELGLLLPTLGITARRLHDTGRTASWVLLLAVPWILIIVFGLLALVSIFALGFFAIFFVLAPLFALATLAAVVILIYFCAQPGTAASNEYGPVPVEWTPNVATPPTPATPPPA